MAAKKSFSGVAEDPAVKINPAMQFLTPAEPAEKPKQKRAARVKESERKDVYKSLALSRELAEDAEALTYIGHYKSFNALITDLLEKDARANAGAIEAYRKGKA